jgi:hypothetical protein
VTVITVLLLLLISAGNYFLCLIMANIRSRLSSASIRKPVAGSILKIIVQVIWVVGILITYRLMLSVDG